MGLLRLMAIAAERWHCRVALLCSCAIQGCSEERPSRTTAEIQLAASLGPQLGPELPVAKPELSIHSQYWTSIERPAWNQGAGAYLVLADSVAWRLDVTAKELDSAPLRMPAMGPVASNNTDWLLAWSESGTLRAARVSGAGALLDPAGFQVATNVSGRIVVASDGSGYLIVWGSEDIHGVRVSATGTILDTAPLAIATGPAAQSEADVAWAGASYVVAWKDGTGAGDIVAARVSPAGVVLDPLGIPVSTGAASDHRPQIASSGSESLIVWQRGQCEIRAARMSAAGSVMDASAIEVANCHPPDDPSTPRVTWDGIGYVIYYFLDYCGDAEGVDSVRVAPSGAVSSTRAVGVCSWYNLGGGPGGIASDRAGKLLFALTGDSNSGHSHRVSATALTAGSSLGTWVPTTAVCQEKPRIAADGTRALVVWEQARIRVLPSWTNRGVGAARLDTSGVSLDPQGIEIRDPEGVAFKSIADVGVAASQSGFLVKVNDDGPFHSSPVPKVGFPLTTVINNPGRLAYLNSSVLSDGQNHLTTWVEGLDPRARRFTGSGTPIDVDPLSLPQEIMISEGVWNGSNYFGVWGSPLTTSPGIRALFLGSNAAPIGSPISIAAGQCPDVSWDGANHFVVWSNSGTVYGARVDWQGGLLDPGGFALGPGSCPRVVYNGSHHVVVWTNGTPSSVFATRVTPGAIIVDSSPITIQSPGFDPDVASFGDNRAFIVYRYPDLSEARAADRVWVRTLSDRCECDASACDGSVCIDPKRDAGSEAAQQSGAADAADAGAESSSDATPASDGGGDGGVDAGADARSVDATSPDAAGGSTTPPGSPASGNDDACSCSTPGSARHGSSAAVLALGLLARARRRRTQAITRRNCAEGGS